MKLTLPVVLAGVLAAANPGVLERVEMYRVTYQQADLAGPGVLKLGVERCEWLGWRGVAYVEGVGALPVQVVDCQAEQHRKDKPLHSLGIAADTDRQDLNGLRTIIVLRRPP